MANILLGTKKYPVRFSYAHVFEPYAHNEGEDAKYSVSILIDKRDKKTLEKIEAAVEEAKAYGKTNKWGNKVPKNMHTPLRDGDDEADEKGEAYEGMYFLNASTKRAPQVVDKQVQPIIDPDEFYSGCYGLVTVQFYPFDVNGNKGVAVGLGNIQKLKDGENLGGNFSTAEDDFEALDDEDDLE